MFKYGKCNRDRYTAVRRGNLYIVPSFKNYEAVHPVYYLKGILSVVFSIAPALVIYFLCEHHKFKSFVTEEIVDLRT